MISQHDLFDYDDYMIDCILIDITNNLNDLVPNHDEWVESIRNDIRRVL